MDNVKCTHCGTDNPVRYKYCSSCGYELPKITAENFDSTIQQPKKERTNGGKKTLGFIVGVIAFGLSFFAVQQLFFKAPPLDKAMMQIASEINKTCPIMIDSETRLDNTISLSKNIFQYNYTLVNIDIATTDTVGMRKYLEPTITNYVKTSPQMKFQRDHETTINYYYKDKTGSFLILISVTPKKYK
jgi:ribosomal protein L37E